MDTLITISAGFAWGGLLAFIHFGGLWLSLTTMPRVARPAQWFYGCLLIRYGITLTGMWLALKTGPSAVVSACVGFYVLRMVLIPRLSNMKGYLWK